jgi:hypothetical protein
MTFLAPCSRPTIHLLLTRRSVYLTILFLRDIAPTLCLFNSHTNVHKTFCLWPLSSLQKWKYAHEITILCVSLYLHINSWMFESISEAYCINPSHQSVRLNVYPSIVARQRLSKMFTEATNTHATELLPTSYSIWSALYERKVGD